jgi:hypothetical protein
LPALGLGALKTILNKVVRIASNLIGPRLVGLDLDLSIRRGTAQMDRQKH